MELNGRTVLVCNCERTMDLQGGALAASCGAADAPEVHSHLCRTQIERFREAAASGRPLLVGCTQEAPLFGEVAAEIAPELPVAYVNIRERAGWSTEGAQATPKLAALLAEAAITPPGHATVSMRSEGACLVYGTGQAALDAARQLAPRLDVTLLLTGDADVVPPQVVDVPIFGGTIVACGGHLGAFDIVVDGYAPMAVSSRDGLAFATPRDGARSRCDLILDMTGGTPLLPAADKREGYVRADPGNPAAVQRALFELVDMVGEFDKPRYVTFDAALCAHSRSGRTGCTRCLDVCPASAIMPAGDSVRIDPYVCGGCGACHSVCPTGAATYAVPPPASLAERLRTLLGTYRRAGGQKPVLLVHDPRHGDGIVSMIARYGDGLPAAVLPFAVNEVTQLGFDTLATALAYGAARVVVLAPPARRNELSALAGQIALVETLMGGLGYEGDHIVLLAESDPDAVAHVLAMPAPDPAPAGNHLPMGDKRSLSRMAASRLHEVAPRPADVVPLPAGAPFGGLDIDADGCTLCLACVGACPTGALLDNPDKPQLRFLEDACVQCGLCRSTCPEKVISLAPRLDFTAATMSPRVVKEEEPFHCVRCDKPFGTKSTIDRILDRLAGKHAMFRNPKMIEIIQMCDDCRVIAQFEAGTNPFAAAERPRVRTTEDYLREREAARKGED